jgi:putative pyruvate formate lyase activating enzyme
LRSKIDRALELLNPCTVCPRDCGIDRGAGAIGVCKTGRYARVSNVGPHFGEEDVLRGWTGSGTIFFAWCNLRCVFCQNFEISQRGTGDEVSPRDLARMMIDLQRAGCHNINFVTPEHVVPQILEALPHAIELGLRLPLVYNTSSYDSLDSIALMDGIVDVYMPDFKLWDEERCRKYLIARDYRDVACRVVRAMHAQVGDLRVDEDGLALRGVLLRHLVMPGMLDDTRAIMHFIGEELSTDTYVNVMDQYAPAWKAASESKFADVNRRASSNEMADAYTPARRAGLWRFDQRWRRILIR